MKQFKTIALVVALITIAAQLYVPLSMAHRYDDILLSGESYQFKVVPRDPADPFKGRYVRLNFPIEAGLISDLRGEPDQIKQLKRKQTTYALLEKDSEGFARIVDLQKDEPSQGDFIKVKMGGSYNEKYWITLPFNRYYAEESKAPKIEALLFRRDATVESEFVADIKIKKGYGVIEELYIENIPILEFLKSQDKN